MEATHDLASLPAEERKALDSLCLNTLTNLSILQPSCVTTVKVKPITPASITSIRLWEEANYPYCLPEDLKAFLSFSNGLYMRWTVDLASFKSHSNNGHVDRGGRGGGGGGSSSNSSIHGGGHTRTANAIVNVGQLRVHGLNELVRVPLDYDDVQCIHKQRLKLSSSSSTSSSLPSSSTTSSSALSEKIMASSSPASPLQPTAASNRQGPISAESVLGQQPQLQPEPQAAFALDTSAEVGNVVLLYGQSSSSSSAPGRGDGGGGGGGDCQNEFYHHHYQTIKGKADMSNPGNAADSGGGGGGDGDEAVRSEGDVKQSSSDGHAENSKTKSHHDHERPQVWFQDLACQWHLLADSFTNYFRLAIVHVGIMGWQHAYTPMGLSSATERWMRLYCPDRLLFDQLQWKKEREATARDGGSSRGGGDGGGGVKR